MQEFEPFVHFQRYFRLWWFLLAAALLGGLGGFLYSRSHPPVYEAIATFMVTIDQDHPLPEPLDMYDKDLALSATRAALIAPQVMEYVLQEAARLGQETQDWNLLANTSIERRHAFWELRFRNPDPNFAQDLVNIWAERGYQVMLEMQTNGQVPAYVLFSPPSPAGQPGKAIYFNANRIVLAGSLLGWLTGLLVIELAGQQILARVKP